MKTFKDNAGREWKVVVNVRTAKRVRDLTGVDLFNIFKQQDGAQSLFGDIIKCVDVLYVLLSEQVSERKMSEEDFAESIYGDVLDDAVKALTRETADFFPVAQRTVLHRALDKGEQTLAAVVPRAIEAIDAMDLTSLTSTTQR